MRVAAASTLITGKVADLVTGAAVAGADVTLLRGAAAVGSRASGTDGRFRLSVEAGTSPVAQNFVLRVRRDGYVDGSADIVIASGRADPSSIEVALLPNEIAECRRDAGHTIVVGYFRPPSSATGNLQLADRIRDTIEYDLLVPLQRVHIPLELQPAILACAGAQPSSRADYPRYAKSLAADAFVGGWVTPVAGTPGSKVKVEMSIADRYDALGTVVSATSPNIDLDDPALSQLDNSALLPIFTALVAGYERNGRMAECVELANAAELMLESIPPALADARARCRAALPNNGLLPGGPP